MIYSYLQSLDISMEQKADFSYNAYYKVNRRYCLSYFTLAALSLLLQLLLSLLLSLFLLSHALTYTTLQSRETTTTNYDYFVCVYLSYFMCDRKHDLLIIFAKELYLNSLEISRDVNYMLYNVIVCKAYHIIHCDY